MGIVIARKQTRLEIPWRTGSRPLIRLASIMTGTWKLNISGAWAIIPTKNRRLITCETNIGNGLEICCLPNKHPLPQENDRGLPIYAMVAICYFI